MLLFILICIRGVHATGSIQSVDSMLYSAYVSENKESVIEFIKNLNKEKSSLENNYLLLKAQYGYSGDTGSSSNLGKNSQHPNVNKYLNISIITC